MPPKTPKGFDILAIYAAGGYLRVIPERFHLIRNGNGHIWVGTLGVTKIKSSNLTHSGGNSNMEGKSSTQGGGGGGIKMPKRGEM